MNNKTIIIMQISKGDIHLTQWALFPRQPYCPERLKKALFYHPQPRSEKLGSEARQVKQSYFSLLGQNGCCGTKAHNTLQDLHNSSGYRKAKSNDNKYPLPPPCIDSSSQWHHCMLMPQLTNQHNVNNGARVGRWWGHSPPTNVAPVQILASKPSLVWVCSWFSPLLQEVFLRILQLYPLLKTNSSKFQFDLESTDTFKQVHKNSKCFVGKQITIFTVFLNRRHTVVVSSVTLLLVLSTIIKIM